VKIRLGLVSQEKPRIHNSRMLEGFVLDSLHFTPSLWSSGQSSWLQTERFGFDFRTTRFLEYN
jgi:hypothetical protein